MNDITTVIGENLKELSEKIFYLNENIILDS